MTRKFKWQQFGAVLHKNYLLQMRGRRLFGAISTGWAGMVAEICVPVLFFLLMWLPKYFFKPQVLPLRIYDLSQVDSTAWASTPAYGGSVKQPLARFLPRVSCCKHTPSPRSSCRYGLCHHALRTQHYLGGRHDAPICRCARLPTRV